MFQHLRGLDVNGLCDSYCKITLQPAIKNVSEKTSAICHIVEKTRKLFQVNQQRSRTVPKNTSPEYASLLHFPGVEKNDLSKLHMHIGILGELSDLLSIRSSSYQSSTCTLAFSVSYQRTRLVVDKIRTSCYTVGTSRN